MRNYYNYYNNRNFKNNKHKKHNGKISSIISTVLVVFAILAVFGGLGALMHRDSDSAKLEYKTIYFMPSDDWSFDGSLYGAWCWSGSGLPAASFVLATDTDEDGVYELKINKEYTGLTFVDLKPDTDSLGVNWDNKRAQTDDLTVPTDKNVYYHHCVNEWSNSADPIYNVTTEEVTVYFDVTDYQGSNLPTLYAFDKTGIAEECFITMDTDDDVIFYATIPSGYTHLIFLSIIDGVWDSVDWQTEDLVIPTGEANYYNLATNEWTTTP